MESIMRAKSTVPNVDGYRIGDLVIYSTRGTTRTGTITGVDRWHVIIDTGGRIYSHDCTPASVTA
jgi:hypothetical protein